jgi:hypothetical protein
MYPSAMIQEIAYERAAELQRSATRSRSARATALAARERDVLARRSRRPAQPDGPIVTARPFRPRAAAEQSALAQQPAPARQPVGVGAATSTAATSTAATSTAATSTAATSTAATSTATGRADAAAEADERVLTSCAAC